MPAGFVQDDYVGYGTEAPPVRWPGGAGVAVSLVVNYEEGAERSIGLGDDAGEPIGEWGPYSRPERHPRDRSIESMFQYGSRVGVWRLLDIFRQTEVRTTFFACAVAFERNPLLARRVVDDGHEVCHHGYRWEEHAGLTPDAERERIEMALRSFELTTGARPVGSYVKNGQTDATREILVEKGFVYDSYSFADDRPYYVSVSGRPHLVLPYSADTNDIRFWASPGFVSGRDFQQYLEDTLDRLIAESGQSATMMSVGLHPRIIGRPARAQNLLAFIEQAKSHPEVWFASRAEIAQHWLSACPPA